MPTEKEKKTAHREAQVLFTTHAKVRAVANHQKNFNRSPFFQYQGVTRQVRIWDEAILPADPIVLSTTQIEEYVRLLKGWDEDRAAALLQEWLAGLSQYKTQNLTVMPLFILQMRFPPDELDDDLQPSSVRGTQLYESDLAQTMRLLAGQTLRVHQDPATGATIISYRESLPREFAPLLILDAGGELAMTYHAWGEGRGNLRQLPSASKSYHNLTTHYWDHRGGKSAHRDNEQIGELALGVVSAVRQIRMENRTEQVLIIHRLHQKPYADLRKRIEALAGAETGNLEGLSFLHYGVPHRDQ